MIFKSKIVNVRKMVKPFFLFILFSFFVFSITFPLLSQAGPNSSPQSESDNPASHSNSLKTFSSPSMPEASFLFERALEAMEKKNFKKAKQNFERLIFN